MREAKTRRALGRGKSFSGDLCDLLLPRRPMSLNDSSTHPLKQAVPWSHRSAQPGGGHGGSRFFLVRSDEPVRQLDEGLGCQLKARDIRTNKTLSTNA